MQQILGLWSRGCLGNAIVIVVVLLLLSVCGVIGQAVGLIPEPTSTPPPTPHIMGGPTPTVAAAVEVDEG
jgi:hypothetical protein